MSRTCDATRLGQTIASAHRVSGFFRSFRDALEERRERRKLRAVLSDLSNRELMDIGTTRGEIDHVALNRGIDPRGIRSGG